MVSCVFNDRSTKNHARAIQGPKSGSPSTISGALKLVKTSINRDTPPIYFETLISFCRTDRGQVPVACLGARKHKLVSACGTGPTALGGHGPKQDPKDECDPS